MTVDCCSHGEDRNPRYEPREEEPGETNPDRKCARDRLPRYDTQGEPAASHPPLVHMRPPIRPHVRTDPFRNGCRSCVSTQAS